MVQLPLAGLLPRSIAEAGPDVAVAPAASDASAACSGLPAACRHQALQAALSLQQQQHLLQLSSAVLHCVLQQAPGCGRMHAGQRCADQR